MEDEFNKKMYAGCMKCDYSIRKYIIKEKRWVVQCNLYESGNYKPWAVIRKSSEFTAGEKVLIPQDNWDVGQCEYYAERLLYSFYNSNDASAIKIN